MNRYAQITTHDEYGDVQESYLEPLSIAHITVTLEEVLGDLEDGEEIRIKVVEMLPEDFENAREQEGY